MSARALGLTCDKIREAEIVMADGSMRNVDASSELFWALQGGGAGNYGIVTNFLFELTNVTVVTTIMGTWTGSAASPVADLVMAAIADESIARSITLACRFFLNDAGKVSFRIAGQLFETRTQQAEEFLRKLTRNHPPDEPFTVEEHSYPPKQETGKLAVSKEDAGLHHFADSKMMNAPSSGPSETCKPDPLPHKVSSAFVKNGKEVQAAETCYKFLLKNNKPFPNASTYISFHGFGGAIGDFRSSETAFPYRDRKLLLQFQAWWNDPADDSTDQYINWVRGVRTTLEAEGLTDGGFFNFQDASIKADRHALMKYYYGNNLDRLIDLKIKYDPNNVFQSGMSIPNKR